jgi:hypothetical protein
MLGFLWRFIARGLDFLFSLVLPASILFEGLLVRVGDFGVFDSSSRTAATFAVLDFRETLSWAGKVEAWAAGVEGTVLEPEHEGVEDVGGDLVRRVVGTTLSTLVFIFLARVVRTFSSSSEEG